MGTDSSQYKNSGKPFAYTRSGKKIKLSKSEKRAIAASPVDTTSEFPEFCRDKKLIAFGIELPTIPTASTSDPDRGTVVFWPDPDFPLREDHLVPASHVYKGKRYFLDQERAKQFACLCMLLTYPAVVGDSAVARSLLEPPGLLQQERLDHPKILGLKVFPNPFTKKTKNRDPLLVMVLYKLGGVGYYTCNELGHPISPIYLSLPPSLGVRVHHGSDEATLSPYRAIVGHKAEKGKQVSVLVKWEDGCVEWRQLGDLTKDGTHFHLFYYARQRKLLARVGWKNIQRWQKFAFTTNYLNPDTHHETIKRVRQQEEQLKQAMLEQQQRHQQQEMQMVEGFPSVQDSPGR